jgi:hypothetical protein
VKWFSRLRYLLSMPNVGGEGGWVATIIKKIMICPFNNNLKVWTGQTLDFAYLWLLIPEPRGKLPWRELRDLYIQGYQSGKLTESRGVW